MRASIHWETVEVFPQDNRAIHVLEIVDLKGDVSVTNDIENVLIELEELLPRPIAEYAVIYRDSMDLWDEVVLDQVGNFRNFAALPRGRDKTELRAEAVVRLLKRELAER